MLCPVVRSRNSGGICFCCNGSNKAWCDQSSRVTSGVGFSYISGSLTFLFFSLVVRSFAILMLLNVRFDREETFWMALNGEAENRRGGMRDADVVKSEEKKRRKKWMSC